ncbi:MAG: TetR/AcrR family transcriptional regulator [Propionibacteriaceae bacterium]
MPKVVDHDERRRMIIDATMRVINRVGLESTTLRAIATEAGVSNGILIHYFASKNEIIVGAHRTAFAAVIDRIGAAKHEHTDPIERLRAALREALPLDEERVLEAHIDVSFWHHAMRNPHLQEIRAVSHQEMLQSWAEVFADIRDQIGLSEAHSDDEWAEDALVFVDGVSVQTILFPEIMTETTRLAAMERFIERVGASSEASRS